MLQGILKESLLALDAGLAAAQAELAAMTVPGDKAAIAAAPNAAESVLTSEASSQFGKEYLAVLRPFAVSSIICLCSRCSA